MFRDTRIPGSDTLNPQLKSEEIAAKFESTVVDVIQGKTHRRDLLSISRDEYGHFFAHSELAPIGTCSQKELECAFSNFIRNITGEDQQRILTIALKEPDRTKHEHYYDKLESVFATLRGDVLLGITILTDDRGIMSATWSLQRPKKRIPQKLETIFSRH